MNPISHGSKLHYVTELINFTDPKLSSLCEISSDGVSDDYYELGNLISPDVNKRNLGFMGYRVSKPPLEIIIKFKYKINLRILKVYSVLSSLKSTRFQVFVQCKNTENDQIFRKICETTLEDEHQGFCLKSNLRTASDPSLKTELIFPYARKSIDSINVIKIVILDTKLRRCPVIKKLEIWGQASASNTQADLVVLKNLWKPKPTSTAKRKPEPQLPDDPSFTIPETFLDSITHELLVMPFILPSGNVIDQSTLEKHKKHEEIYGRLPSDPFTGLIFTPDSQPKFDEALKVRLDEFLLKNSNETEVKLSGRTVGKKIEPVASTSRGYSGISHVSKKIKLDGDSDSDLDSLIRSIYQNKQVTIFTKPEVSKVEQKSKQCESCEKSDPLDLYKISCQHLYCKKCVMDLAGICGNCGRNFSTTDVEKFKC